MLQEGAVYKLADRLYRVVPFCAIGGVNMGVVDLMAMDEDGERFLRVHKERGAIFRIDFPSPGERVTEYSFQQDDTEYMVEDLHHVETPIEAAPAPVDMIPSIRYDLYGDRLIGVSVEFRDGQQTSWLATITIPDSCIEAKTRDGSFDRAGRYLRYAVRPDSQLVSYNHPIMGEPTEHRFADLVTPVYT